MPLPMRKNNESKGYNTDSYDDSTGGKKEVSPKETTKDASSKKKSGSKGTKEDNDRSHNKKMKASSPADEARGGKESKENEEESPLPGVALETTTSTGGEVRLVNSAGDAAMVCDDSAPDLPAAAESTDNAAAATVKVEEAAM